MVASRVFAVLAPLIAARRSMRLWDTSVGRYADRTRALTTKLPNRPAAVPVYLHRRTRLLVLDFDAKHGHTSTDVDLDVRRCQRWLSSCGARPVTDRSTSGGRHILVPLPLGLTLTRGELEPVLRRLAARLPSLDISPMLNDTTGAITPPGTRCRTGGFRTLEGTLTEAVCALTTRSAPDFWDRLRALLADEPTIPPSGPGGASVPGPPMIVKNGPTSADHRTALWEGSGEHARLRTIYRRTTPIPAEVLAFAHDGAAPSHRWRARNGRLDRSRARQSVLVAAAMRGYTFTDVLAQLPANGGEWVGLDRAYHRYGRHQLRALHRDWAAACAWTSRHAHEFLAATHKEKKHTGGQPRRQRHEAVHAWLSAAVRWADAQWPRSSKRWTVHAVLQALAYASALRPIAQRGLPIVEFGGRSLSLLAGGLPETTVWQTLRAIRDLPGAPIRRVCAGAGCRADRYALTTPALDGVTRSDTIGHRVRVEPVHPAWRVLGLHCRRLYEVVTDGATDPLGAFAAARLTRSSGYTALHILTTVGLLHHRRRVVGVGSTNLDQIAHQHGLAALQQTTVARHRAERARWRSWLTLHSHGSLQIPSTPWSKSPSAQDRSDDIGSESAVSAMPSDLLVNDVGEHGRSGAVCWATPSARSGPGFATSGTSPTTVHARDSASAEVYIEAAPVPRAGGRWLIFPDDTVYYLRPTGVRTASTVPAHLLRTSPVWRRQR
ncbi:hypothetical protein [Nocardia farcinica]|uniref:hypothetical protein n=1 Tax=Nocardia farcinica TaxID=37329 RepID=UPI0018944D50|nr:hypothetical protein [Nocardia farcinica]MBF6314028.1 hypothetical protein [Nocardia farcinica]UEX20803.1 hypothetical protein LMJ57_17405 [Nocardia farcinica]